MMLFPFLLLFLVDILSSLPACHPKPGTPVNTPMGVGKGVKSGRVSWAYDPDACSWDGKSLFYWNSEFLDQKIVDKMVSDVVMNIADEKSPSAAWDRLFRHFNIEHFGKDVGYSHGEKIAVKVNLNVDVNSYKVTKNGNTISPQFMKSVLRQLVHSAGVSQEFITMIDASRAFVKIYWDPPVGFGAEFPHVNIVDNLGGQPYAKEAIPDPATKFYFSDHDVLSWNTTLLPKTLLEAKYVIEIDAFRGHSLVAFTATGKNWFGGIYRPDVMCGDPHPGHWCPASLHRWVNVTGRAPGMVPQWLPARPMGVYNPLVDLLGHSDLAAKGLIFFTDATYGGTSQLGTPPILFKMPPFNGNWSCSAFASLDPIALDSVLFDFLRSEPNQPFPRVGCADNYLHEGSQANSPPSGTVYAPSGTKIGSLGVHEHWNNLQEKEYSRNLGRDVGIELLRNVQVVSPNSGDRKPVDSPHPSSRDLQEE